MYGQTERQINADDYPTTVYDEWMDDHGLAAF